MGESYRKKALHLLAVDMVRDPAVRIVFVQPCPQLRR